MKKCIKLRRCRPKAVLGEIAGAGISAAATLAAAGISAAATASAAKQQAQATEAAAKLNSEALAKQNENATKLQEQNIEFTKNENERNRELMQNAQFNSQIQAAQMNQQERLRAANILKNGGVRYQFNHLLRAGNIPFNVTDGGGVIPLGTTKEGYDLYEVYGNDHEHYHKTKNGKYKSGVGINFQGIGVVEGEGNQNTNQGELLMVTPTDARFISKHSNKGFNPTKAIMEDGMEPVDAFAIQETLKNGESSDNNGKQKCGGKAKKCNTRTMKCGGRKKAWLGDWSKDHKSMLAGAGISSGANLIGAGINSWANNKAASTTAAANTAAANYLINAYNNMTGIDMNLINRSDFQAAHVMPVLRAPRVNVNPQLAQIERSLQRSYDNIEKNSMSGAASLNRKRNAEINAFDMRSSVYNKQNEAVENILQENAKRITEAAESNANRDVQANKDYANTYLNLLQYNNEIENEKLMGAAQARADALTGNASVWGQAYKNNASNWSNALASSTAGFTNVINQRAKDNADIEASLLGATPEAMVNYRMQRGTDSDYAILSEYNKSIEGIDDLNSRHTVIDNWLNAHATNRKRRKLLNGVRPINQIMFNI